MEQDKLDMPEIQNSTPTGEEALQVETLGYEPSGPNDPDTQENAFEIYLPEENELATGLNDDFIEEMPSENIVPVATVGTDYDSLSFNQAFAAARDAMGPGGSFVWHGRVYSTYYENEWDAMTPDEQHQFSTNAIEENSHLLHVDPHHHSPLYAQEPSVVSDDEIEVSILGMDTFEVDNQTVNLATLDIDGDAVYMIDLDNDNVFDYAIGDFDGSGQLLDTTDDMIDISGEGLTVNDIQSNMDLDPGIDLV